MLITAELRQAIEHHELALLYQPIVDLASGRALHAEALLRWKHPVRGLVTPAHFMPAVERSGLIRPFFAFALATALEQCAAWRAQGIDLRVAVNLSVRNLLDPGLVDVVSDAIERSGITASWLGLEITESMLMVDPERALKSLTRLRNMGVSLSIDDFGTGYSSLAYLARFPFDILKIDKAFVDAASDSAPGGEALIKAIVDIGSGLHLKTVAEGIEQPAQASHMRRLGCDAGQGYLFARPMPADEFTELLSFTEPGHLNRGPLAGVNRD